MVGLVLIGRWLVVDGCTVGLLVVDGWKVLVVLMDKVYRNRPMTYGLLDVMRRTDSFFTRNEQT